MFLAFGGDGYALVGESSALFLGIIRTYTSEEKEVCLLMGVGIYTWFEAIQAHCRLWDSYASTDIRSESE